MNRTFKAVFRKEDILNLKQRVSKIEEKQSQILIELSEIKGLLENNNNILIDYMGTYKDKKMRNLRNTMMNGHFNTKQVDSLSTIVSMFREVLEDKENVEKELESLKEK